MPHHPETVIEMVRLDVPMRAVTGGRQEEEEERDDDCRMEGDHKPFVAKDASNKKKGDLN